MEERRVEEMRECGVEERRGAERGGERERVRDRGEGKRRERSRS